MSASLLAAAGLTELIASDLAEYERRAIELAHNPDELQNYRERVQAARENSPLFDTTKLVRNIESAMLRAWERHASGRPHETIFIE